MWKNNFLNYAINYLKTQKHVHINCGKLGENYCRSSLGARNVSSQPGKVIVHKSSITVDLCEQPLNVNLIWLRDHCRCSECYNYTTNQRRRSIVDTAPHALVKGYILENDFLEITWIDQHNSRYKLEWLLEYCGTGKMNIDSKLPKIWNKNTIKSLNIGYVNANEFLNSDEGVTNLLKSIIQFGVGFIKDVSPTIKATEQVIQRISHAQRTFFGEMWEFSDSLDHQDTAYTREALGAHTDNTYFSEAAGLQVFHCLYHDGDGGETLLVDGFYVANYLKQKHFQCYDRLTKSVIESEFKENDKHYLAQGPILKVDPLTEELQQVRFNMYDRAPLRTIPMKNMQQFYEDFICFSKVIADPACEWWFKLQPGTVLVFNNWRVLHGRAAYTGHRTIAGCYIGHSDWCSKARTLRLL